MANAQVVTVRGDILVSNLAHMVNGLFGVVYPELQRKLAGATQIFIPETADGAVITMPDLHEVAVCDSPVAQKRLPTRPGKGDLLGFSMFNIGWRLAFAVGGAHLTISRQQIGFVKVGSRAHVQLIYRSDDPMAPELLRWLERVEDQESAQASEDEIRALPEA